MNWFYRGLVGGVLFLLISCATVPRLPASPTVEATHELAIISQVVNAAPSATPYPPSYLPFIHALGPTRKPTSTGLPNQPVSSGHTFPSYSTSLYMKSVDGSTVYKLGCEVGLKDLNTPRTQDSLVILAYGYPKYLKGQYGARLYGVNGPVTIEQISFATKQFAWGYYTCTGTDFDSHLRVGIGTSNYEGTDSAVNFAHGATWGRMVNEVNEWLRENGASGQVDAVGANDIELSWNSYTASKDWIDGYDSVNRYDLVNFGAIEGCPYLRSPGAQCGNYESHLWSYEQVWYVIYGAGPVYPLPEIYLTSGVHAEQWYLMSLYSVRYHGAPIQFLGSLTTYQACQQVGGCSGTGWGIDNTPKQGWTQLYTILNKDTRTSQGLRWASDMKWTSATAATGLMVEQAEEETGLPAPQGNADVMEALRTGLAAGPLSDTIRLGLQEKLAAAEWAEQIRQAGAQNPAPKDQPAALMAQVATPEPPSAVEEQIIAGSEGLISPSQANIENLWMGMLEGEETLALAGALSGDPTQGVLIVLRSRPGQVDFQAETFLAPPGMGSLQIVERQGNVLVLEAENGAALRFDLANRVFQ